jgi:integrase
VDKPKQFTKEYSLPKKNHRLLQEKLNVEEYIINYLLEMRKKGRKPATLKTVSDRLRLLATHCNILDPEEVKETLANIHWKNSTKNAAISEITPFYFFHGIKWNGKPHYQKEESLPFIPTEAEIDQLIASAGKTYQALLQLLKETGVRIGEAVNLQWSDYDSERKVISVNEPEKGSKPRMLPISEKLRTMLGILLRTDKRIFPKKKHSYRVTFEALRDRIAERTSNIRIKSIHFHTFRHYFGTMEYHKTKDLVHVQICLGHRDIKSTMVYINIEQALWMNTEDEWISKVSHDITEETKLINAGFELVRAVNETTAIYRKRK